MSFDSMSFINSLPPHMRPKAVLQPKEASQEAQKIKKELFNSWYRLRAIVLAHEDGIQKRWKKRTAIKRKQILEGVNGTLPKEHAPEVSAFAQSGGQPASLQEKRNDFLLPYLNLEDLSVNNGMQFLGLLHARVHHAPSEFAWFDYNTIHFGVVAGAIQRYHALDCAMVAYGDESTYGNVLEYAKLLDKSDENSPDGFQMEHLLRESMSFGDGLVVLDAQKKLLDLLLGVVTKILIDLDLTDLAPAAPLPAPEIPLLNTAIPWQSSARENAMRPYGPPPVFSIDALADLLEPHYELAVQHLADLRTDPMYLAEIIQSYYDHRIETILNQAPPAAIQNRAVSMMLTDAYTFLAFYRVAKGVIDEFRVVQTRFPSGAARARELPQEYENALMSFHPILGLLETHLTKIHHQTLCASSALRAGLSVRCTDPAFHKHEMGFRAQPGDKLFIYMRILLQKDQTHLWQLTRLFDELDRTTQDSVQHQRISPLIASLLSQWGVVNDCKSIIDWHRPAVEASEEIQEGIQKRLQKWHPLLASILFAKEKKLADKAFPVSRFVYPKGPRDAGWAQKCQRVDDAFAAFWTAADKLMVKECGQELFALGTRVVAPFAVEPTDWVALATPKEKKKPTPGLVIQPFGGAAQSPAAKDEVVPVKAKPKTRGVVTGGVEDVNRNEEAAENFDIAPPTPISAKAHKVFSTLFNAGKDEEIANQQSSVAWKDILVAFAQLDFKLQKTRGSAWTFHHPDGRHSVTVHEPHPESTMRFWEARRFGRRLTRRFGWTLESFVLDPTVA
ncbi:hypothetical protein C8R44DRAFT_799277 [Mycena epipterygia]|nr:hypothetical protein C8R44DRAFT_799277 [Mycena epipterygia]